MASFRTPDTSKTAFHIAETIINAKGESESPGRTVFLIGAGCSITARIPGAASIAREQAARIATRFNLAFDESNADDAHRALCEANRLDTCAKDGRIDWHAVYDQLFERHFKSPDDVRRLFNDYVDRAEGAINWAHLSLGEMVHRRLISTVLTTNFDQLALKGMALAGTLPVVSDGLESFNRISGTPNHPQLIEVHGSRHTYLLRNREAEVSALNRNSSASGTIRQVIQGADAIVVVGYGGREEGVMTLLVNAAMEFPHKSLFWVAHDKTLDTLADQVRAFLDTSGHAAVLLDQDADGFFLELMRELKIGVPAALSAPLAAMARVIESAGAADHGNDDIKAAIAEARRVHERLTAHHAADDGLSAGQRKLKAIREAQLRGDMAEALELAQRAIAEAGGFDSADDELLDAFGDLALERDQIHPDNALLNDLVQARRAQAARHDRAVTPDEWARAQHQLGVALSDLGERETGTARLEDAVAAYREALKERTRERVPLDWAETQNNLGNALAELGEREPGTARLEDAVTAFREALKERTQQRVPLDWAGTQNNLGTALAVLGRREPGTAQMEDAVTAYREALKEWTRGRVPLDWAMTQNNLGNALQALGEREAGTARLVDAVATYREALKEWTRDRVPLDWATAQNNLGAALQALGERETGTAQMEEAVAAYREALEERRRDRVPLEWAGTQNNLGDALRALGERETGTARLEAAIAALHSALEVLETSSNHYVRNITRRNLARAKAVLAERQQPKDRLSKPPARAKRAAPRKGGRKGGGGK